MCPIKPLDLLDVRGKPLRSVVGGPTLFGCQPYQVLFDRKNLNFILEDTSIQTKDQLFVYDDRYAATTLSDNSKIFSFVDADSLGLILHNIAFDDGFNLVVQDTIRIPQRRPDLQTIFSFYPGMNDDGSGVLFMFEEDWINFDPNPIQAKIIFSTIEEDGFGHKIHDFTDYLVLPRGFLQPFSLNYGYSQTSTFVTAVSNNPDESRWFTWIDNEEGVLFHKDDLFTNGHVYSSLSEVYTSAYQRVFLGTPSQSGSAGIDVIDINSDGDVELTGVIEYGDSNINLFGPLIKGNVIDDQLIVSTLLIRDGSRINAIVFSVPLSDLGII